ncbi:hypothetical protein E2C01_001797 [Portunus trituberculatus]|uniref:Secreted protein n=1 Tax=Portunus trituberculatus TaxID=210409 RepID=A0A5B7CKE4_PORTR|nr:hypothetical protein [Portunus trituberculatus]
MTGLLVLPAWWRGSRATPLSCILLPVRKWLPPPLRKLSQGRVDRVTSPSATSPATDTAHPKEPHAHKQIRKAYSERRFKMLSVSLLVHAGNH